MTEGFRILTGSATPQELMRERRRDAEIVNSISRQVNELKYNYRKVVKTPADFGVITNNTVTPEYGTVYMLDGFINMGSVSITVPSAGCSIAGLNGGRDIFGLYSTASNYTMFVNPSDSYAGNLFLTSMSIPILTGSNSKVFDLDNNGNNGAVEFQKINFGGFAPSNGIISMGTLKGYRQGSLVDSGFYFMDDGLEIDEQWSGLIILDSNVIGFSDSGTFIKKGPTGSFTGSFRSNLNFLGVGANSVFTDFADTDFSLDGGFRLDGFRTIADDAIPNIDSASEKVLIRNSFGIRNTNVGGQFTISTPAATVISATNTPVKMAGTTTYVELQHFTQTTNNAFIYNSDTPIEVDLFGSFTLTTGASDTVNIFFRIWDNSAGAYDDDFALRPKMNVTMQLAGLTRAENVGFGGLARLEKNDRVEVWVENTSSTTNITASAGGYARVTER